MLNIFEQLATNREELEPEALADVPADFPEMVDSFQWPVAYQSGKSSHVSNPSLFCHPEFKCDESRLVTALEIKNWRKL